MILFPASLLLFAVLTASTPVEHALSKRNPCDGVNASPVLYHEYLEEQCPAIYHETNGVCAHENYYTNDCAAFCQVRTSFVYGREQPVPNTYCHGPQSCTIGSSYTVTVGWNVNISPQTQAGLGMGITGGWSTSSADAISRANTVKLEDHQCGYFTIVPVIKRVCGTLSIQKPVTIPSPSVWVGYCSGPHQNTYNYCSDQPRHNSDGTVDSETVFVRTDCASRMPLPMSQQDPVYQRPDVPLDRGTQEAWAETWGKPKLIGADGNSPVTCETSEGSPLIDHCIPSLDFLLDYPDDPIPNGLKEHTFWTAYQHSCAVSVFYKEDWDESCDVTLGDIAAAAYPIFTQCSDDALGKVGGVRKFGEGKCAGFLQIIHTHGLPPNPT